MTPQVQKRRPERHNPSGNVTDADRELLEYVLLENARGTDLHGVLQGRANRLCKMGYLARLRMHGTYRLTRRGIAVAARSA